jgi:hypothetical protein
LPLDPALLPPVPALEAPAEPASALLRDELSPQANKPGKVNAAT